MTDLAAEARHPLPYVQITNDAILAALMGETVTILGPLYIHTVTFVDGNFHCNFYLGIITCDEANLRLIHFI
jgi:hypothetical protein